MIRRRRRGGREEGADLEVLPMMNLFVVLIPMLLLSAVFAELAVIRMGLPSADAESRSERESLGLAVAIEDDRWIVRADRFEAKIVGRDGSGAIGSLRRTLAGVTASFPENRDVVILSYPHTRYEDIISVMDISRETGLENLSLLGAES
jgi:biopolymer transport protein ExbD